MSTLDEVMRKDFTVKSGVFCYEMVALYNRNKVSQETVDRFIRSGEGYHPDVLVCLKQQFENVFFGGKHE